MIVRHRDKPWLAALLKRRPYNVVEAAVANKLARTIWAVLAKGVPFDPNQFATVVA